MKYVPINFSNIRKFKLRSNKIKNINNNVINRNFFLLKTLNFIFLKEKQLIFIISYINKNIKKKKKSSKKYWITITITNPITKKGKGSRMGKGKGKYYISTAKIYKNSIFLIFYKFRLGKLLFIVSKLKFYLGLKLKLIYNYKKNYKTWYNSNYKLKKAYDNVLW